MKRHYIAAMLAASAASVLWTFELHSQTRASGNPVSAWGVAHSIGTFEVRNAYGPLVVAGGGKELIVAGDSLIARDDWVAIQLDTGELQLAPGSQITFTERDGRRAVALGVGGLKYATTSPMSFQLDDSALVVVGIQAGLQKVAANTSSGALGVDESSYAVRNTAGTAEVRSAAGVSEVDEGHAVAFDSTSHEVIELAQLGKTPSPNPCAALTGAAKEKCEDEERKAAAMSGGSTGTPAASGGGGFSSLSPAARAAIVGGGIVVTAVAIGQIDDDDEDLASPR